MSGHHKSTTSTNYRILFPHFHKVKEKSSLASHHKSTTWTDDKVIDPNLHKVKEKSHLASQHKSTTWLHDKIIDPHFHKSRGNPPWRVTTSGRLGQMMRSSIHNSIRLGEIIHGELPQANDLDR